MLRSNLRKPSLCLLCLILGLIGSVSCSDLFVASNIAINPVGSEGQVCSGTFFAEQFELCRRESDGAMGAFEVFMDGLEVTDEGEVLFAEKLVVGIAEITQTFRNVGTEFDGAGEPGAVGEVVGGDTFADLFWQLKDFEGKLLQPHQLLFDPLVNAAVLAGDADVIEAMNFVFHFISNYHFNSGAEFNFEKFFDCVDEDPDSRDPDCLAIYDFQKDGELNGDDLFWLVLFSNEIDFDDPAGSIDDASDSVVLVDVAAYRSCKEGDELLSDGAPSDTALLERCLAFDADESGTVDRFDLHLLFLGTAPDNFRPIAGAGADQTVAAGATIVLDGTDSFDLEDSLEELDFVWVQVAGLPGGSITAGPFTGTASYTAPFATASAEVKIKVTVTDTGGRSDSDTVTVNVSTGDEEVESASVTAEAGATQTVTSGAVVILDGSASDGSGLSFSWTQVSGSTVTLTGAGNSEATFVAPAVDSTTLLQFRLTVTDDQGASDSDEISVAVTPAE